MRGQHGQHGQHRATAVAVLPEPIDRQWTSPRPEGALDPSPSAIPPPARGRTPATTASAAAPPQAEAPPTVASASHRRTPEGDPRLALAVLGILVLFTLLIWVGLLALPGGSTAPVKLPAPAS